MAKDTYYFKHDYNARNDLKMQAFLHDHKGTGYGIYWVIAEILHEEETHSLPLKRWVFLAIAKQINEDVDLVENIVKVCISDYELFFEKDGNFFSKRVNHNISERSEISAKRSLSGKAGANAKQTQANGKQKSEERKGKERKEDNKGSTRKMFVKPSKNELQDYFSEIGLDDFTADAQASLFMDHFDSNGWKIGGKAAMKDWRASARTWKSNIKNFQPKNNLFDDGRRSGPTLPKLNAASNA